MKTSVLRNWRWGMFVGLVVALSACGGGGGTSTGAGSDLAGSRSAGLTAPNPGEGPRLASDGTEQLVAPGEVQPLVVSREVPLVSGSIPGKGGGSEPEHKEWHPDPRAVAIEGEEAPGTGGERFDSEGFGYPTVNEVGNAAFIACYGGLMSNVKPEAQPGDPAAASATDPASSGGAGAASSDGAAPADAASSGGAEAAATDGSGTTDPANASAPASTADASGGEASSSDGSGGDVASSSDASTARSLIYRGPGAGIFYWNREHDRLAPVAITGQCTDLGFLPEDREDYKYPQINDRDQIAFVVRDIETLIREDSATPRTSVDNFLPSSALFQAQPTDDKCEHFDLEVIAKRGDPAPGGGEFYDFGKLAQNENGDIAFIGYYVTQFDGGTETTLSAPTANRVFEIPVNAGVFLYKADCHQIVAIVRADDVLPYTGGETLCEEEPWAVGGVWLNDDRIVTFQANCIGNRIEAPAAAQAPKEFTDNNELDGSIFIRRPHEDVKMFLKIGSEGPSLNPCGACSYDDSYSHPLIVGIHTDEPGLSEHRMAFKLDLADGLLYGSVLASKKLEDDAHGPLDVCAVEGQDLGRGYTLGLSYPVWNVGTPSYSSDGIMGFIGLIYGWENNCFVEKTAAMTCYQDDVHVIVREGDRKPVGKHNEFGTLDYQSNSDRYQVFLDLYNRPTGVYEANTNPQLQ